MIKNESQIVCGMEIGSFIDHPDGIATVIYFQGCNFNCNFCHSKQTIEVKKTNELIKGCSNSVELANYMIENHKAHKNVVISGGEPSIHFNDFRAESAYSFQYKTHLNQRFPDLVTIKCDDCDFEKYEIFETKIGEFPPIPYRGFYNGNFRDLFHSEVFEFCKILKSSKRDFNIKINTNGTNLLFLRKLHEYDFIDYITVDIKCLLSFHQYQKYVPKITYKQFNSILLVCRWLIDNNIRHEFRTTMAPGITKADIFKNILKINKMSCVGNKVLKYRINNCLLDYNTKKFLNTKDQISVFQYKINNFLKKNNKFSKNT